MAKKPCNLPDFQCINTLDIGLPVALVLRREHYMHAMRALGILEDQWHQWPMPGGAFAAAYHSVHGKHIVVALGDFVGCDGIEIASVLVHESVHVWQSICEHISESRPADEQSAYAIQAIATTLMRDFVRQTQ